VLLSSTKRSDASVHCGEIKVVSFAPDLTIEDFEELRDTLAFNHELVDGELVAVPGNIAAHNMLRSQLLVSLHSHIREHKLGLIVSSQCFDFEGNGYAPDLSFVGSEKMKLLNGKLRVQRLVPDVAVDIVSPDDGFETLMKRTQRYLKAGSKEVWILSIEMREAYVFSDKQRVILDENQEFRSNLIPGFSIRLGDLFDRI
jgi:Uma2 family endonuclease